MYYIILIAFAILMIWISEKSSMLRNNIFNAENFAAIAKTEKIKKPKASYSLGRSQLAFWTVIVASSFVYLLLSQSAYPQILVPVLDTVNLTLISIAAGTTVISKVIDSSQKENQNGSVPQQDYPSEGFFIDIISDEKGVSIHRLQNVIWTVIVGGIYIAYVSGHTTLPDDTILTSNLLGLMGISTAAYLGLKLNENKGTPNNTNVTNETPNSVNTIAPSPTLSTTSQPISTTVNAQPETVAESPIQNNS
ncbi:hypothetical protein AMR72_09040 [Flavobacterium psychrophilum]|nr:hypothetical protein AMR72_09040 [Flavobacterium psychrophilum]AOE52639.1 hypothetical protein ALW18_09030 [Flavobacterium psychrophilum]